MLCFVLLDQLLAVFFGAEISLDEGYLAFTTGLLVDIIFRLFDILLLLRQVGQGNIRTLQS